MKKAPRITSSSGKRPAGGRPDAGSGSPSPSTGRSSSGEVIKKKKDKGGGGMNRAAKTG